ncbi:LPD25 domain-containing protein [Bacillus sp. BP-3]|uniref:LPD25 domain-containing protein n=1 Tax=Bacillus sp. BP-3 TaxID=3022773 RepID=UPI00232C4A03|nr:LPD25 domain-containing protein [Bacillus sp. BP-3]MDC2867794.1 ArdC-like ssDNA-binding domain-containing protein [Bacillus sp. BP-3]
MQQRIDQHFHSTEDLKEYLSFMAKFYRYSPSNVALVQSQFQGATAVGSFSFWKEKGFSVRKGEKGIQILVPNRTVPKFKMEDGNWKTIAKATEDEKKKIDEGKAEVTPGRLYFNIGHVFDISQTNATTQDLPKIFPNRWLEGEVPEYASLYKGMEAIAEKNGIKIVEPKEELGVAKGVSYTFTKEVALNPRNSELQNVKTLLHELAHAKLHTTETHMSYGHAEKEFQAEMTAYVVSSHFGLDTSGYSLGYLASWTKGKELKEKTKLLKEVHETSVEFIEIIENTLEDEKIFEKRMDGMDTNKEEKNILLIEYGALSSISNEMISVGILREKMGRENVFNNVENAEKLTDKEFIGAFNEVNKQKFVAVNQNEITRPTMIINWSESNKFRSNQFIPFGEANEQMKDYIRGIEVAKEEAELKGEYIPYEKTRYVVVLPKEVDSYFQRMEVINPDRLDLGDGIYKSPYQQILEEKRFLSDEVKQALANEVISYRTEQEQKNDKSVEQQQEKVFEKMPNEKSHLVTIEILPNAKDEEVGRIHMMDGVTKDMHMLSVWNGDPSNQDDLYVSLTNKTGQLENVYLDNILKHDLYQKVQDSIFENKGNTSFLIHDTNARIDLDELVKDERYGKWIERDKQQLDPFTSEKEREIYQEMRQEGYAPIASVEPQHNSPLSYTDKHVTSSMEKELSEKYEDFKRAQYHETVGDIDSIITRVKAEERYFATKTVSIENELITQDSVTKLENRVREKLSGEGITTTNHATSRTVDMGKQFEPLLDSPQKQNATKKKKQEMEFER